MRAGHALPIALLGIAVVCSVVIAGSAVALSAADAAAQTEDDVTITDPDATQTPERTVEIEGESGDGGEFTVDAITAVEPGEPIDVTVETPEAEGTSPHVELRTSDEDIEASERILGGGTKDVTFETDGLEPGTYGILVWVDGSVADVSPVVVEGYDLVVETPDEPIAPDGTATVSVDVESIGQLDWSDVAAVEVAAWSDGTAFEGSATEHDSGTYTVQLDLEGAPEESFDVYVAAVSEREVDGYPAALAIEGSQTIDVEADAGDGENAGDGGAGGGFSPGDGSDEDQNETDTGAESGDDGGGDGNDGDGGGTEGEEDDDPAAAAEDDSDVIQPSDDGDDGSSGPDDGADSVPGFGAVAGLAALLAVAGLARVRCTDRS